MNSRHLCYMAIVALLMLGSIEARAQQGMAINSTGAAANASAMLDVSSTTKGVLVPRIASPASVPSPATGLMIYNTTTNQFNYWNGSSWVVIGAPAFNNGSAGGQILVTNNLSPFAVNPSPVSVSGDATLSSAGALTLANSGVAAGTYGSTTTSPQITVDAKGRVTSVSNQTIAVGSGSLYNSHQGAGASATVLNYSQFNGLLTGFSTGTAPTFNQSADIISGPVTLDAIYVLPSIFATYISGPANIYTGTVYKNGVATAMTVTVPTGTTNPIGTVLPVVSDNAHTISLVAGDKIAIQWSQTNSINGELANMQVSVHGH